MKHKQQTKSAVRGAKREGSVTLGQEELIKRDRETLERLTAQFLARDHGVGSTDHLSRQIT